MFKIVVIFRYVYQKDYIIYLELYKVTEVQKQNVSSCLPPSNSWTEKSVRKCGHKNVLFELKHLTQTKPIPSRGQFICRSDWLSRIDLWTKYHVVIVSETFNINKSNKINYLRSMWALPLPCGVVLVWYELYDTIETSGLFLPLLELSMTCPWPFKSGPYSGFTELTVLGFLLDTPISGMKHNNS